MTVTTQKTKETFLTSDGENHGLQTGPIFHGELALKFWLLFKAMFPPLSMFSCSERKEARVLL